jgi:protocatechuate 3,4-dioxygenase beta subunit
MNRVRVVLSVAVAVLLALALTSPALEAQTATIRGTVTDSATQGALQGALVTVLGGLARAETNQSGQYALRGIAPGTVRVRVQLIGYTPAERELTVADGTDATSKPPGAAGRGRLG